MIRQILRYTTPENKRQNVLFCIQDPYMMAIKVLLPLKDNKIYFLLDCVVCSVIVLVSPYYPFKKYVESGSFFFQFAVQA